MENLAYARYHAHLKGVDSSVGVIGLNININIAYFVENTQFLEGLLVKMIEKNLKKAHLICLEKVIAINANPFLQFRLWRC